MAYTPFNTGNPIGTWGSVDPRDLVDNAAIIDRWVNDQTITQWRDRFGVQRLTWNGMEIAFQQAQDDRQSAFDDEQAEHQADFDAAQAQRESDFNAFLLASGYQFIGDYDTDGPLTITQVNQIFSKDGEFWRAGAALMLPYTTVNDWATDEPKFVTAGDAALRQQLADPADPNNGAALVGFNGRTVADSLANWLHASDEGVVGDFVADDTAAFIAACAKSISLGKPLYVGSLKIRLSTLTASINTDGLVVIGDAAGFYSPPSVFNVMLGTENMEVTILPDAASAPQAIIYSPFNGALFSGKRLDFENVFILCNYAEPLSSGFVQSTPTAYPGWSKGLAAAKNVGVYYTGSHGIELKGGWEVGVACGIRTGFNGGIGLYIHQQSGVNSPIEYISFDDQCAFTWGLLGNVVLDGVSKFVRFGRVLLNNAGQVRLAVARNPSFTLTNEADVIYGIRMAFTGQSAIETIEVDGAFAEECQGLVKTTGNFGNNVQVRNTYIIPLSDGIVPGSSSWIWRNAYFGHANSNNLAFEFNASLYGNGRVRFDNHVASSNILLDLKADVIGTLALSQRRGYAYPDLTSGTLGDGSAGTFTSTIAKIFPAAGANEAARHALYLITSNFQGSGSTGGGSYLMAVTRQNSGNYIGYVFPSGSTTGFSSAPTIDSSGVISVPLSANYRSRIARIDHTDLTY